MFIDTQDGIRVNSNVIVMADISATTITFFFVFFGGGYINVTTDNTHDILTMCKKYHNVYTNAHFVSNTVNICVLKLLNRHKQVGKDTFKLGQTKSGGSNMFVRERIIAYCNAKEVGYGILEGRSFYSI